MEGLLKIVRLFQAFIELSKHSCDSTIKLTYFFDTILGIDLALFKTMMLTEANNFTIQKAFQYSRSIKHFKKGFLYKLLNFERIKHFDIRVVDLYELVERNIIDRDKMKELQALFKQYYKKLYDDYLITSIKDKFHGFAIETDILHTNINDELIGIYDQILDTGFIAQFIETINTKENNTLFDDYYVYIRNKSIHKFNAKIRLVLRFLVDYDLTLGSYFAYAELEHVTNRDSEDSNDWQPLFEICLGYNEDNVYAFIDKFSNILSERAYYTYNNNDYIEAVEFYYDITLTKKDLLNFVKCLIFASYITNL